MENTATQNQAPAASQTTPPVVTPEAKPVPSDALQKELEELRSKVAEKDRYIADVTNEKATLEARLNGIQQPTEPQATGNQFRPEDIPMIVERTTYANKIKETNQDLIELGLEPSITNRALELERQGKTFRSAVDTAVSEAREKLNKITNKNPPPAPNGALGETGNNPPAPPPPVKKEMTEEEEHQERYRMRSSKGL